MPKPEELAKLREIVRSMLSRPEQDEFDKDPDAGRFAVDAADRAIHKAYDGKRKQAKADHR